jgi:hypothetical protein
MAIIKNQNSGHVATLDIANATYTTANLSSNSSIETVTGMGVAHIFWTGDWVIKQGATVLFQSPANTAGFWDLTAQGLILQGANTAANITANTAGSSSTLSLILTKYAYNTAGVGY